MPSGKHALAKARQGTGDALQALRESLRRDLFTKYHDAADPILAKQITRALEGDTRAAQFVFRVFGIDGMPLQTSRGGASLIVAALRAAIASPNVEQAEIITIEATDTALPPQQEPSAQDDEPQAEQAQ